MSNYTTKEIIIRALEKDDYMAVCDTLTYEDVDWPWMKKLLIKNSNRPVWKKYIRLYKRKCEEN